MIEPAKRLVPERPVQLKLPTSQIEPSSRSDIEEQKLPPTTDLQPDDGDDPRDRVPVDNNNMTNLPLLSTVIGHLIRLWKRVKSIQPELPPAQRERSAGFDIEGQQYLPTADRRPDDGDDPRDRVPVDNNNMTNLPLLSTVIGHLIRLWKRVKSIQPELPPAQRERSAGFDIEGQQYLPTADRRPDDGDDPRDRVPVDNNNMTNLQSLPAVIGPCFTAISIGIALQYFQTLAPVPATFPLSCMAILLMFCAYWASIILQRHYPKASSFMGQVSILFAIIPVVLVFPVEYRAKLIFIAVFIFGGLVIKVLPLETGHRRALNIHPQP
ncbi:uncharacterized protein LOC113754131 [Coffea eugenioides]|uniref:uncharacterized protein LOC113754131 n=1 Tax=Coffea eugenioides TaxID=49369 RepID=UPI000F6150F2|nr:uncharacterized protein LOC113754131 [Coffea eugenioides]